MAQWFYRRRFLNFHYFLIISPWKMFGPSLNKLIYPSSRNALCQVWLKLAHWFWRRRFLNFVDVFSLFQNHLPLEKREALHLNKLIYPSPNYPLCQVCLKLAQWFVRSTVKSGILYAWFFSQNFFKSRGAYNLLELISSPFFSAKIFPHIVNQFHMLTSYSAILIF